MSLFFAREKHRIMILSMGPNVFLFDAPGSNRPCLFSPGRESRNENVRQRPHFFSRFFFSSKPAFSLFSQPYFSSVPLLFSLSPHVFERCANRSPLVAFPFMSFFGRGVERQSRLLLLRRLSGRPRLRLAGLIVSDLSGGVLQGFLDVTPAFSPPPSM